MPQKGGEPVRGGSKCQLKDDVKNGGEVHCAPLLHRRREANLLRRADGLIVQTVSQALQDALYLHLPGGLEETSSNTWPSIPKLRASSVYAGLGPDRTTTPCTGG